MLNVFKKLGLSLLFFDPTEETSGIAGETFWKSLCLMTGERRIMEKNIDARSAPLKEKSLLLLLLLLLKKANHAGEIYYQTFSHSHNRRVV